MAAAGCGGPAGDEGTPALSTGTPGEGGHLTWTVPQRIRTVDPLAAANRSELLAARQIHEPLTARVVSPFDPERTAPGLARRARSSGDATIWTLRLRRNVVFQDGEPFNGSAVTANALRWQTTAAGRALLPGLVTAGSPKPDVVQFVLSAPDPRFDRKLARPELGIVSPRALRPSSGEGAIAARSTRTGTGAFELFGRGRSVRLLAQNTTWWGREVDQNLGPALDQVEFRAEPRPELRLALLDAGDAQVAEQLGPEQARIADADPLLVTLKAQGARWLGLERSVRGIDSARRIPSLARAWLTTITTG